MTLPTSGSLSLRQIIAEFNGPADLRAYYRGGPYVSNTVENANISTNPAALSLRQFYGASAIVVPPLTASITVLSVYPLGGQTTENSGITYGTWTMGITSSGGAGAVSYSWVTVDPAWSFADTGTNTTNVSLPTLYSPNVVSIGSVTTNVYCIFTRGASTVTTPAITLSFIVTTSGGGGEQGGGE